MKMTWLHTFFWLFFIPAARPLADFDGAAIPPPIFSMSMLIFGQKTRHLILYSCLLNLTTQIAINISIIVMTLLNASGITFFLTC